MTDTTAIDRAIAEAAVLRHKLDFLRPEVLSYAWIMEQQLRANDWKTGWKGELVGSLLAHLRDEISELQDAIVEHSTDAVIVAEAADVGNMAMMVADVRGALPILTADAPLAAHAAAVLTAAQTYVERERAWLANYGGAAGGLADNASLNLAAAVDAYHAALAMVQP